MIRLRRRRHFAAYYFQAAARCHDAAATLIFSPCLISPRCLRYAATPLMPPMRRHDARRAMPDDICFAADAIRTPDAAASRRQAIIIIIFHFCRHYA
jgi:hypothetical protein